MEKGGIITLVETRQWKDAVYEQFGRIGKALSSPRRLEIMDLLAQAPKSVETVAAETGLSVANASRHLQVLLQANLVHCDRRGTFAFYRLSGDKTSRLLLALQEVGEEVLADVQRLRDAFFTKRDSLQPLTLAELRQRLEAGDIQLVDVRPKEEYDFCHIPGAISVPIFELDRHLSGLAHGQEVVAYCRGRYCVYALDAVERLRSSGFAAVRLEVGVREWNQEKGRERQ